MQPRHGAGTAGRRASPVHRGVDGRGLLNQALRSRCRVYVHRPLPAPGAAERRRLMGKVRQGQKTDTERENCINQPAYISNFPTVLG